MKAKDNDLRTPEHNILIGEVFRTADGDAVLRVKKGKEDIYENVKLTYLIDQFQEKLNDQNLKTFH